MQQSAQSAECIYSKFQILYIIPGSWILANGGLEMFLRYFLSFCFLPIKMVQIIRIIIHTGTVEYMWQAHTHMPTNRYLNNASPSFNYLPIKCTLASQRQCKISSICITITITIVAITYYITLGIFYLFLFLFPVPTYDPT